MRRMFFNLSLIIHNEHVNLHHSACTTTNTCYTVALALPLLSTPSFPPPTSSLPLPPPPSSPLHSPSPSLPLPPPPSYHCYMNTCSADADGRFPRTRVTGATLEFSLPTDKFYACDITVFTIWCRQVTQFFTRIDIPADLFVSTGKQKSCIDIHCSCTCILPVNLLLGSGNLINSSCCKEQ